MAQGKYLFAGLVLRLVCFNFGVRCLRYRFAGLGATTGIKKRECYLYRGAEIVVREVSVILGVIFETSKATIFGAKSKLRTVVLFFVAEGQLQL